MWVVVLLGQNSLRRDMAYSVIVEAVVGDIGRFASGSTGEAMTRRTAGPAQRQ